MNSTDLGNRPLQCAIKDTLQNPHFDPVDSLRRFPLNVLVNPRAIVLLSGGLDSATALALAIDRGYEVCTMSFDYGQRHKIELECASRIVEHYGVKEHRVVRIQDHLFFGSALTDKNIDVPVNRSEDEMGGDIPVTYVPARNTIFLSFALSWAESINALSIFNGVNFLDYSGYPDCRPEYIIAYQRMAELATKRGVNGDPIFIVTPLINWTKIQIVSAGLELGVPYKLTSSCYNPITGVTGDYRNPETQKVPIACGVCDSCILRRQAFVELDVEDPTLYREGAIL